MVTKAPIKTRREIGKLAQARRAQLASEQPKPIKPTKPLIFQAMDDLDGMTYPIMGPQLVLAGAGFKLSRELRVGHKQFITKVEITLKKGGK